MKRKIKHILTTSILGLLPSFVLAMVHVENDSILERDISEVRVVASYHRPVITPQILSGSGLQQLAAYSLADAVRYFSGVQIKDYGGVGGMKTVDMRSMGSNHLGVFYDGIEIGNAQNGTVDLGRFSLDNMEAISVYNGQKSDIFQPAKDFGTSGSIYLTTRRPVFVQTGRACAYNLRVKYHTGSFGQNDVAVLFECGPRNSNISLSANAEYIRATGKYRFRYHKVLEDINGKIITAWDTAGTRQNGDIRALRSEVAIFGSSANASYQVKAYYYDSERGIPRAIVRNVWTSSQRQWDRNIFVQGYHQIRVSDIYSSKNAAKYSYDYMRYYNPDTTLIYTDNKFTQQSWYLSSANLLKINERLNADISVDYEHNWMASNMVNFAEPKRDVILVATAVSVATGKIRSQASLLGNYILDQTTRPVEHRAHFRQWTNRYTPSVFVSYDITDSLHIRGFYKKMFRKPTFNDLYYTDLGNISLKPEYAQQFDVGISYDIMRTVSEPSGHNSQIRWKISADIYHNRITDKIVAVPKGNSQYRWMMMNIGKVYIYGLDASSDISYDKSSVVRANLHLSYTYQQALDKTDKSDDGPRGTYNGQISYIPRHSGSAVAGLEMRSWHLSYSFIYVGERYHVSANIPENYEPSWYTHDLGISKYFAIGRHSNEASYASSEDSRIMKHGVRISGEVNNLLDQQYDVVLNYPMPGRNIKITLTMTI